MLVLSRQRDETIMIGDDIEITVVDIRGDKVRLGITAPKSIAVHRKEVYEAIKRENRQAAQLKTDDLKDISSAPGPAPSAKEGPGSPGTAGGPGSQGGQGGQVNPLGPGSPGQAGGPKSG